MPCSDHETIPPRDVVEVECQTASASRHGVYRDSHNDRAMHGFIALFPRSIAYLMANIVRRTMLLLV
jgi:hypothetical protein